MQHEITDEFHPRPQVDAGVPTIEVVALTADDGARLGAVLDAPRQPRGALVILGAMATPSRFYRRLSERLARGGWAVLRFDYRGVGLSRQGSLRGNPATLEDWIERDVEAALAQMRRRFPDLPLAILGHSLGGQIVGLAPRAHGVDAVVLVAAQSGWVGHWPPFRRTMLKLLWRGLVPVASALAGYMPGWVGLGEDVPTNVVRQWARWCMTPGYVTGVLDRKRLHFDAVRVPVLAWSLTDDDYAPGRSIDELLSWLRNADVEHRRIDVGQLGHAIGHFGFFREANAPLWDETLAWLDQVLRDDDSIDPAPTSWSRSP